MKQLFVIFLCSITITATAQTKIIAFKSHSGDMSNFKFSLENELFDDEASNFGAPSHINSYRLDSVIYVSANKTVLVRSIFTRRFGDPSDSNHFVRTSKDTVLNDPLFSKKHSLDSIKTILKTKRMYDMTDKKVTFIGYDNNKIKEPAQEKEKSVPPATHKTKESIITPVVFNDSDKNDNAPFAGQLLQVLSVIALLALSGAWITWKINAHKKPTVALIN